MKSIWFYFASLATVTIALSVISPSPAQAAPSERVLYNFTNPPQGPLALDRQGNVYGTTYNGGNSTACQSYGGCGTVFELTLHNGAWIESTLYSFQGGTSDGASPYSGVILDAAGNLYGTTPYGGSLGCGTVFEVTPSNGAWTESIIHNFQNSGGDGCFPVVGVALDPSGNLYGVAATGGVNFGGIVFELTPSNGGWTETVLYSFINDGELPNGVVMHGGTLFGTTNYGGLYSQGSVFKLKKLGSGWVITTIHSFTGADGGVDPYTGVTFDKSGNLYGTTASGGDYDVGTVYQLTPAIGEWGFTVLHSFSGAPADGARPYPCVTIDATGDLYGTTGFGGTFDYGTVYKLAPSSGAWTLTLLHNFTGGNDGGNPYLSGVKLGSGGSLFGSTNSGAKCS